MQARGYRENVVSQESRPQASAHRMGWGGWRKAEEQSEKTEATPLVVSDDLDVIKSRVRPSSPGNGKPPQVSSGDPTGSATQQGRLGWWEGRNLRRTLA